MVWDNKFKDVYWRVNMNELPTAQRVTLACDACSVVVYVLGLQTQLSTVVTNNTPSRTIPWTRQWFA